GTRSRRQRRRKRGRQSDAEEGRRERYGHRALACYVINVGSGRATRGTANHHDDDRATRARPISATRWRTRAITAPLGGGACDPVGIGDPAPARELTGRRDGLTSLSP